METPTPTSAARDSNAASEFKAIFPPQYTILGVKLLPLSIGRYRLMKWAGVAFVSEEEGMATIEDLFTGIAICGMQCRDFKQLFNDGKLQAELSKWGKKLRKQINAEKGFSIYEKIALFQQYIEEGQTLPWVALPVQTENPPDYTNTHWSNNVEVVLRGSLGWTKDEIDEEPLAKALADYFKHMENKGRVRLMPHELYLEMVDEGEANMKVFEKMAESQKKEALCPA
jgi:hypothetical protein